MAYTQAPIQVIKMAGGGSPPMETWNNEDPPPDGQGWQRYNRGKGEVVYQRPAPAQEVFRGEDPPNPDEGYTRVRIGRDDYIYTRPIEPPVQESRSKTEPPPFEPNNPVGIGDATIQVVVYGPDGTAYGTPAAAKAAGVYQYYRQDGSPYPYSGPPTSTPVAPPVAPPVEVIAPPYVPYNPPPAPPPYTPPPYIPPEASVPIGGTAPPYTAPVADTSSPTSGTNARFLNNPFNTNTASNPSAFQPRRNSAPVVQPYNNASAYGNVFNPTPTALPMYSPPKVIAPPSALYNNSNAYGNVFNPTPMTIPMYSSGGSVTPAPMYSSDGTQINQDFNDSYDNLLLDYYPTGKQIEKRGGGRTAPEAPPGEGFNPSPAFARSMLDAGKTLTNYPVMAPLGIAARVAGSLATKYGSYLSSVAERNAAAENAAKNPDAGPLGVQSSRVHDQLRSNEAYGPTLDGPPPSGEREGSQSGGGYGGGAATGGRDTGGGTRDASGGGDRGTRGGFAHGGIADPHLYNLLARYYANSPR